MLVAILVLGCSWAWGATNAEPRYDIDIPSLDAAEALTRLAEQTDTIVLFPYDLAQGRQANEVVGRFTLTQAVEALLRGTGIAGSLSDKRVLQISLDGTAEPGNTEDGPMEEPEIERRPLLRRIGATLAAVVRLDCHQELIAASDTQQVMQTDVGAMRQDQFDQRLLANAGALDHRGQRRTTPLIPRSESLARCSWRIGSRSRAAVS